MENAAYWEKRSLEDKKRSINLTETFINRQLKKNYTIAVKEVQEALNQLYQAFADAEHITLQQARKRMKSLNSKDLETLYEMLTANRKSLKEKRDKMPGDIVAAMEKRLMVYERQLKNLSQKGYATHLELMEIQIHKSLLGLADQNQMDVYDLLEEQYRDGYFRGVFDIQKGVGFGKDFTTPDHAAVRKAVMRTWSKRHFSAAIWGEQDKLTEELRDALTVGLIRGEGVDRMTKRLTDRMNVSGSNARRLVRTESAHIHEQSTLDSYRECGIEEYQFLATLDRRTSPQCRKMDGEVIRIEEAQTGVNYPPLHPNCRSTTVAHPGTDATRRIARGADGKTYEVPGNMTYQQWYAGLSEDERGLMSLKNRKDRNAGSDQRQYDRYKAILGNAAGSKSSFLNLKYGNEPAFKKLQRTYKEKKHIQNFQQDLAAGKVNLTIQVKKQEEHTRGTKPWRNRLKQALASQTGTKPITPQSFLYENVNAKQVVAEYSGKGIMDYKLGSGTMHEYVTLDYPVGRYYNVGKKRYVETKRACILYNGKGTHVFAVKEV